MKRKIKNALRMTFKQHSVKLDLNIFKQNVEKIDFGYITEQGNAFVDGEIQEFVTIKIYFKKDNK